MAVIQEQCDSVPTPTRTFEHGYLILPTYIDSPTLCFGWQSINQLNAVLHFPCSDQGREWLSRTRWRDPCGPSQKTALTA